MNTVFDRIVKVMEELSIKEEIKPNSNLEDDLSLDSLDMVELMLALEGEFGNSISDEEAQKMETVQDIMDYIDGRIKECSKNSSG